LILLMMETIIFTTATTRVEIKQLRIEIDQIKRQKQVGDIEDTEFFQDLQAKANQMRQKNDKKE
ncbi:MAG: HAMP domain-containing protein, partial [Anaerolineae bacterium]|nr:HAMP domain-containing protein [Anaerolineae bacterium]